MGEDDNQNDATLDEIDDVYQPRGVEVQVFAEDVLKVVEEVSAPKLSIVDSKCVFGGADRHMTYLVSRGRVRSPRCPSSRTSAIICYRG